MPQSALAMPQRIIPVWDLASESDRDPDNPVAYDIKILQWFPLPVYMDDDGLVT